MVMVIPFNSSGPKEGGIYDKKLNSRAGNDIHVDNVVGTCTFDLHYSSSQFCQKQSLSSHTPPHPNTTHFLTSYIFLRAGGGESLGRLFHQCNSGTMNDQRF